MSSAHITTTASNVPAVRAFVNQRLGGARGERNKVSVKQMKTRIMTKTKGEGESVVQSFAGLRFIGDPAYIRIGTPSRAYGTG